MANLWTADASGLTSAAGPVNADDGNWTADGFIAADVRLRNIVTPQIDASFAGFALAVASAATLLTGTSYKSNASTPQQYTDTQAAYTRPATVPAGVPAYLLQGSDSRFFYSAEGLKVQFQPALSSAPASAPIPYTYAPQQFYTDIPSVVRGSLVSGQTPPIIPYVSAYQVDPSQLTARYTLTALSPLPRVTIPYFVAPAQAYTNIPPAFQPALRAGQTPPIIPYVSAYPIDVTQLPAHYTPAATKAGVSELGSYTWAFQTDRTQLQPLHTAPSAPLATGILGRYQLTLPQVDSTLVGQRTPTAAPTILSSGILGTYQFAPAQYTGEGLKAQLSFPSIAPIIPPPGPPPGLSPHRKDRKVVLPTKIFSETVIYRQFDFISLLYVGETITSATASAFLYSGSDPSPGSIISGSATVSGTVVSQMLTGGRPGTIYIVTVAAQTNIGETIELSGYLAVTANSLDS
jgi:hypothetical protein